MSYVGCWRDEVGWAADIGDRLRTGLGPGARCFTESGPGFEVVVASASTTESTERDGSFGLLDGVHHAAADGGPPPGLADLVDRTRSKGAAGFGDIDATAGWTVFHRGEGRVLIGRDAVGNGSMFVADTPIGTFWSPRLALLRAAIGATEVDWVAFDFFVTNGFTPSPWTLYRDIRRLGPGEAVTLGTRGVERSRYHSFVPDPRDDLGRYDILSDELPRSVASRVAGQGRTGVLLSGGVDSQLMMAMIAEQTGTPPVGFTFQYTSYDGPINEGDRARRCADFLGAEHVLVETDPLGLVKRLPDYIDATGEPLARTIHTVMLDVVADFGVDVLITGDGADSLYLKGGDRKTLAMAGVPGPARSLVGSGAGAGHRLLRGMGLDPNHKAATLLDGVARATTRASVGMNTSMEAEFIRLRERVVVYRDAGLAVDGEAARVRLVGEEVDRLGDIGLAEKLRSLELRFDGADDLLRRDLDIAQIHGISIRSPFFSTNVMNRWMSQQVPQRAAAKETRQEFTKIEVRKLAASLLPDRLANAPKLGHSIPVIEWMRGPLLPWIQEVTSPTELNRHGVFDPEGVKAMLDRHLAEQHHVGWGLWSIASASVWLDQMVSVDPAWVEV